MRTIGYYRDMQTGIECNEKSHDKPLIVNCTGRYVSQSPFVTHLSHGRKDYYIQLVLDGELTADTAVGKRCFTKGEFIIWEAEKTYHYEHGEGNINYLFLHFTGFNAARSISDVGLLTNRIYSLSDAENSVAKITCVFERLFSEFADRKPFFDEAAAHLLSEILVNLARCSNSTAAEARRLVTAAYLHQNFGKAVSIEKLAEAEHLSVSRYRELFKAQTGLSPSEYRAALRINHACRLLSETDLTVSEIAVDCGYNDIFYFMRVFKQWRGMTPGEYRDKSSLQ